MRGGAAQVDAVRRQGQHEGPTVSLRSFYWTAFKKAIEPSFQRADAIAFVISVLGGVVVYRLPGLADELAIGAWLIPLVALLVMFSFRLVTAPFSIYQDEHARRLQVQAALARLGAVAPNVLFTEALYKQMHRRSVFTSSSLPRYAVLEAWFENRPDAPTQESVATNVTATIEFSSEGLPRPITVNGQWALTAAPRHVGFTGTSHTADIPPGSFPSKLLIAVKYQDEPDAYAYSAESSRDHPDGRDPTAVLQPGQYQLRITLTGIRLKSEYSLTLTNHGRGQGLSLAA